MTDDDLITKVAELWIENGGDDLGIEYTWVRIRDKVKNIINSKGK